MRVCLTVAEMHIGFVHFSVCALYPTIKMPLQDITCPDSVAFPFTVEATGQQYP